MIGFLIHAQVVLEKNENRWYTNAFMRAERCVCEKLRANLNLRAEKNKCGTLRIMKNMRQ